MMVRYPQKHVDSRTVGTWRLIPSGCWFLLTLPPAHQKNVQELITPSYYKTSHSPLQVGTHGFDSMSLLCPPLPGKAIKLFFSTSPKTVSKTQFSTSIQRSWVKKHHCQWTRSQSHSRRMRWEAELWMVRSQISCQNQEELQESHRKHHAGDFRKSGSSSLIQEHSPALTGHLREARGIIYLFFIFNFYLFFYLIALGLTWAWRIFSCSMSDLVPWPGIKPGPSIRSAES